MTDQEQENEPIVSEDEILAEAPKDTGLRISREEGDDSNATYIFTGEDHTLGNLLRSTLIKNEKVEFCAYSVPHPSEPYMNVRI